MDSVLLNFKKLFSTHLFLLTLVLSMSTYQTYGQKKTISFDEVKDEKNYGRFRYIEVRGHTGYHLYTGELLDDALNDGYGAVEFRYGWQMKDPEHWSSRYNYATYGVGYYSGLVGSTEIIGKPNAVFGFLKYACDNRRV